jgi:hypothetical protein
MKKVLVLLFSVSLYGASFATTSWDKPFGKSAFDDPYVDNYNVSEIGAFGYPNHAALIQADFNVSVPAPYYVVIQVFGVWAGIGSGYKQFTLLYNTGQWHKSITYPLVGTEQVYPEVYDLLDYGPQ